MLERSAAGLARRCLALALALTLLAPMAQAGMSMDPAGTGAMQLPGLRHGVTAIPMGTAVPYPNAATTEFDLVVVLGQSNNFYGTGADPVFDRTPLPGIASVMRIPTVPANANKIVIAAEPLENEGVAANGVDLTRAGYARSMAVALRANYPGAFPRPILIYRYAIGGTGFRTVDANGNAETSTWTPDSVSPASNYNLAVAGVQAILKAYPGVHLRGVAWDDGEEDYDIPWTTGSTAPAPLQATWVSAFNRLRTDTGIPDLPIVTATLSPAVATYNGRSADIRTFKSTYAYSWNMEDAAGGQTGIGTDSYAGALGIADEVNGFANDDTHFSAATQRNYRGPRFAAALVKAMGNNTPGGTAATVTAPAAITDLSVSAAKSGYLTLTMTPPGASGGPSNGGGSVWGYAAQVSTDGGTTWVPAPVRWGGKGRDLTGLTNGTATKVRVAAYNAAGQAPWSNVVTATPNAADLTTALVHKIVPNASGSTVGDAGSAASAVTASALTYGNDGSDYLVANGSTGDLTFPAGTAPTQELTMAGWVYITNLGAPKGLFGEWTGTATLLRNVRTQYSGAVYYLRTGSGTGIANSYTIDTTNDVSRWMHVALTITADGSGTYVWRLYIDGTLKSTATGQAAATIGDNYRMGYVATSPFNALASRRSALRIYNRALDQDSITALVAAGRGT